MELSKQIGNRLRDARAKKRLTQEEVGKILGIGRAGYANIETGRSLITVEHLLKMPGILGEPVTYFLGLSGQDATKSSISDSAKIDDIWKALQQNSPPQLLPKKDYPEDNHPEIEIICEIWEQLDAAERQIVYDFVRWRYDEQYRRRTSSGKRRVDRSQKEKDRQYNIDVIDLRLSLEKASADQIALAISSLQEVLAEKIAREAASAGTLKG